MKHEAELLPLLFPEHLWCSDTTCKLCSRWGISAHSLMSGEVLPGVWQVDTFIQCLSSRRISKHFLSQHTNSRLGCSWGRLPCPWPGEPAWWDNGACPTCPHTSREFPSTPPSQHLEGPLQSEPVLKEKQRPSEPRGRPEQSRGQGNAPIIPPWGRQGMKSIKLSIQPLLNNLCFFCSQQCPWGSLW